MTFDRGAMMNSDEIADEVGENGMAQSCCWGVL